MEGMGETFLNGLNEAAEPVGLGKFSAELAESLATEGHQVRMIKSPPLIPQ